MFAKNLVAEVRIMKLVTILFLIGFVFMGTSHAATVYVDDSAAGGGDGSIGTPFQTITDGVTAALALAGSNTVAVAGGNYTEATGIAILNASDLTLQGGYDAAFTSQDPSANETTLNGPAGVTPGIINVESSTNLVIDGLTLANGNAADAFLEDGGGIRIVSTITTATVSNCIFRDCFAAQDGGGAAVDDGAQVTFDNCRFIDCESGDDGGGLNVAGGTPLATNGIPPDGTHVTLTDCLFQGCRAIGPSDNRDAGGARFAADTDLTGCTFDRCFAARSGGAFICEVGFETRASDCVIKDCSAGGRGGGIFLNALSTGSQPTALFMEDCVISGCECTEGGCDGGAIMGRSNASGHFTRTSFLNCSSVDDGGVIRLGDLGNPDFIPREAFFTNCVFANNQSGDSYIAILLAKEGAVRFCTFFNNSTNNQAIIRAEDRDPSTLAEPPQSDIEIANCLFIDNDSSAGNAAVIRDDIATVDYCLFENNLIGTAPDILLSGDPFVAPHVGNVTGTVNFTNVAANDFSVFLGSANIDAGVDIPSVVVDFIGNPRSAGAAPDIGAYEFTLPAPPSSDVEDWSLYR